MSVVAEESRQDGSIPEAFSRRVVRTRVVERSAGLLVVRLFLIAGWTRAGAEKLISSDWWRGETLRNFAADQSDQVLGPYAGVLEFFATTVAAPVALVVMALQLLIAAGLTTRRWLRPALWAGIFLNVNFVLAGAVNPSVFYLVMQIALLLGASSMRSLRSHLRPGHVASRVRRSRMGRTDYLPALLVTPLIPLIETIEPAAAIDDPALILVFLGYLCSLTLITRTTHNL